MGVRRKLGGLVFSSIPVICHLHVVRMTYTILRNPNLCSINMKIVTQFPLIMQRLNGSQMAKLKKSIPDMSLP